MRYLVTGKEMKLLDQNTSSHFHVPELVLMEQAAMHFVWELCDILKDEKPNKGIVFCGTGNNGADGLAIARLLNENGISTDICLIEDLLDSDVKTSTSYQLQKDICRSYVFNFLSNLAEIEGQSYDFVIDAIFGIGLTRPLDEAYIDIIEFMNRMSAKKIAVDMPSGIHSDNGQIMGAAARCDYTITFSYGKLGHYLWPGNEFAGFVKVVPIGITDKSWLNMAPTIATLERSDLKNLPKRTAHSNKGTYGKVLVIAGSTNMAGAAIFAANAAYRSGAGLVKIFTCQENRKIIQTSIPECLLTTYDNDSFDEALIKDLSWADSILIGPGLGVSTISRKIVDITLKNATSPLVIDADALNIISEDIHKYSPYLKNAIVTPHLGEFSRLTGHTISYIQSNFMETAVDFAKTYEVICVLKDFRTVTTQAKGIQCLNLNGNHGMATGGSGDILTGIITTLLAQNMDSFDAASYGVFLHGLAGDLAATEIGTHSMTASDIIEALKEVWKGTENAKY